MCIKNMNIEKTADRVKEENVEEEQQQHKCCTFLYLAKKRTYLGK